MPVTETSNTIDISVIICAYTQERWDDLITAVASLKGQTVAPREIIVVIDHNKSLFQRVQQELPQVTALENQQAKGLSGARNSGAIFAQGSVVAFLDDDAFADPTWIEHLVESYADPDVSGVGGKIAPFWTGTRPSWFPAEFDWVVGCTYQGMPVVPTPVRNMIGANMSVRRHLLSSVDGFRPSFGCDKQSGSTNIFSRWFRHSAGDEETEFCLRLVQHWPNAHLLYVPAAMVHHHVSAERMRWHYFVWRCYNEGLGKAAVVKLHGSQKSLSSERNYTSRTLPLGIVHNSVAAIAHGDFSGLARAAAILLGFTTTVAGYIVGTLSNLARSNIANEQVTYTHERGKLA